MPKGWNILRHPKYTYVTFVDIEVCLSLTQWKPSISCSKLTTEIGVLQRSLTVLKSVPSSTTHSVLQSYWIQKRNFIYQTNCVKQGGYVNLISKNYAKINDMRERFHLFFMLINCDIGHYILIKVKGTYIRFIVQVIFQMGVSRWNFLNNIYMDFHMDHMDLLWYII